MVEHDKRNADGCLFCSSDETKTKININGTESPICDRCDSMIQRSVKQGHKLALVWNKVMSEIWFSWVNHERDTDWLVNYQPPEND